MKNMKNGGSFHSFLLTVYQGRVNHLPIFRGVSTVPQSFLVPPFSAHQGIRIGNT